MALSLNQQCITAMNPEERQYFKALGRRISQRRQEVGFTQTQVADTLGIAQQTYASYEGGIRRIPVSLLLTLAKALTMDIEALLGAAPTRSKRGPAPRFQQHIEQISRLPKAKQQVVLQMLEGVLAQHSR